MFIRIIAASFLLGIFIFGNINAQDPWNTTKAVTNYKTELKQYLKNIESNPRDKDLLSNIGEAYFYMNQMTEAKQWFAKAVDIAPLVQKHQLQYAKCLMALQDYGAAKNWFLLYAETNPEVGTHYAEAVDIAIEMGKIAPIYTSEHIPFNTAGTELSTSIVGDRLYYLIKNSFSAKLVYADGINGNSPLRYMGELNTGIKLDDVSWFSFSSDRKKVVYVKQKSFVDQRQIPEVGFKGNLFIADVKADGMWINAKEFPHNNQNNILYPSFSDNGNTIYFASDRLDGFGGLDIYYSSKNSGNWSFPMNAGPDINTPGHEISPSYVNGSLYFSSNWHEGFGGYDVFRADLASPENVRIFHQGKGVNSSRDDIGLQMTSDGKKGFLVSNRLGTAGAEDLYSIRKGGMNAQLYVFDALLKTPIVTANIDMSTCGGTMASTDSQGRFVFNQATANDCSITVFKDGYEPYQLSLNGNSNYTVSLSKTASTLTSTLDGIVIDESSGYILENVNVTARENSTGKAFSVISDSKGQFNFGLSVGKNYTLTFSKSGFKTTAKDIQVQSNSSLGITSMMKNNSSSVVSKPSSPGPIISTPSTSTMSETMTYAVQIAAIKPGKQFDLNGYKTLNSVGEVFVQNGSDYNRIRVGKFKTKAEAERARSIIKSKGYKSAYVVEQVTQATISTTTSSVIRTPGSSSDSTTDKSPVYNSGASQEYRIRLAALSNPENFNYATAQQYGKVETTQSNGFTVFYVVGIKDLENGRIYLQQLKNNGFSDAYLVQNKNGILSKVR